MDTPDADVVRDVDGCVAAHRRLLEDLGGLTDAQAGAPSRLPGWTVGHVLTHLARNADGIRGMFEGAERGEVVSQYPSAAARTADIEAGAGRPAAELVADATSATERLEACWRDASAAAWAGHGVTSAGRVPLAIVPGRRWREVEVHHADLGLGFTWADWSDAFVRVELGHMAMLWASRRPMGMTDLPAEALAVPDRQRLAWLLGRVAIDGLEPAGVFS